MKNSRDTIWCNYRVIITAVRSVCCRQTNLAFNQHEGQSVGRCSCLQMRGRCFWVLYQMSPCYFGLCRHMQDVARSQICSVCLCMIVKGTAHRSSPPWHAQAVSHCVQPSTPWPLCAVAKWSQRRGQSMCVLCVCVFYILDVTIVCGEILSIKRMHPFLKWILFIINCTKLIITIVISYIETSSSLVHTSICIYWFDWADWWCNWGSKGSRESCRGVTFLVTEFRVRGHTNRCGRAGM